MSSSRISLRLLTLVLTAAAISEITTHPVVLQADGCPPEQLSCGKGCAPEENTCCNGIDQHWPVVSCNSIRYFCKGSSPENNGVNSATGPWTCEKKNDYMWILYVVIGLFVFAVVMLLVVRCAYLWQNHADKVATQQPGASSSAKGQAQTTLDLQQSLLDSSQQLDDVSPVEDQCGGEAPVDSPYGLYST